MSVVLLALFHVTHFVNIVPQCGNGFVEDGEDCDPTDLDQAPCCNSTCHFLPIGSTCGPQAPCDIQLTSFDLLHFFLKSFLYDMFCFLIRTTHLAVQ